MKVAKKNRPIKEVIKARIKYLKRVGHKFCVLDTDSIYYLGRDKKKGK